MCKLIIFETHISDIQSFNLNTRVQQNLIGLRVGNLPYLSNIW